jgi:hypothetical protein
VCPSLEGVLGRDVNPPRLGSGEARSCPLSGPSLDLIAPIRPLQLCADGGYQLRLGVLGVPLIMVPDNSIQFNVERYDIVSWEMREFRGDETLPTLFSRQIHDNFRNSTMKPSIENGLSSMC